ncbi:MAG: DUF2490 domain-containing protein [Candidatus Omnitrophota bacterium]
MNPKSKPGFATTKPGFFSFKTFYSKNLRKLFSASSLFVISLFLAQGILIPRAAATPAKNEDFGVWSIYDVEKKINAQWKMKVGEELRFREHNGLHYEETHVAVDYKPIQYLALGAEYQQICTSRWKNKQNMWYWDSVPRIYVTPQYVFKGFSLEDRNMLEFRIKQQAEDSLRYRNLVTLTAPWKWTRFQLQPYTSNEIFIETGKKGMNEDRYFSGVKVHWWGPVYGSIFYLLHSTKSSVGKWTVMNILGTSLKVVF